MRNHFLRHERMEISIELKLVESPALRAAGERLDAMNASSYQIPFILDALRFWRLRSSGIRDGVRG
jgi:hypothetical protein